MTRLDKTRVLGDLTVDGTITAGSYSLNRTVSVFTTGSGATYTAPTGLKYALVIVTGGGGGGGGADG